MLVVVGFNGVSLIRRAGEDVAEAAGGERSSAHLNVTRASAGRDRGSSDGGEEGTVRGRCWVKDCSPLP